MVRYGMGADKVIRSRMARLQSIALLLVLLAVASFAIERAVKRQTTPRHRALVRGNADFVGCPTDNDFYYNGTINSPLWPAKYPPNDQCYYYMTAAYGHVLSFTFPHFDLETCCDYVTIYDGYGIKSPILARFGGPNSTSPLPSGTYYSSNRFALVTFTSDKEIEQSGFQMNYQSVFSTSPCNRDILLVVNGLSTVGTQANFVKQLQFLANSLTPTWQVGPSKVRVMMNLQVDDEYAMVYDAKDVPSNNEVSSAILGMTDWVPDVTSNNNTSLNCLFRYAENDDGPFGKNMGERPGIEQVAIIMVSQNANNDQDYYQAFEYAQEMKRTYDVKVIIVAMGSGLNTGRLGGLSDVAAYTFAANYDSLNTLVAPINKAICADSVTGCGP